MKRWGYILLLALSVGGGVFAGQYEQMLQTQRMLEDRVNALVRIYDPQGFSIVTLDLKKEQQNLPGVPFVFEDYTLPGDDGLAIERLKVAVVTRLDALPADADKLIRDSLKAFSKRVTIELRKVPPLAEGVKPPMTEMRIAWPESTDRTLWIFGSAIGALLLLAIAVFAAIGFGMRGGLKAMANSLSQGLGGLKESLESGAMGAGPSASEAAAAGSLAASGGGSGSGFEELSTETCLALLSDCYWCGRDDYGAFLWQQMGVTQRKNVVAAWPSLEKYVRHIQTATPKDYGFHTDVNYLTPLPYFALDNSKLTEIARKSPSILKRLSPLRTEALALGVEERLQLQDAAAESQSQPDWKSEGVSEERTLRSFPSVRITTESGETEAIALRDLSVEAKEQFITLAWMVQLPRENVTALLDSFSARELAQAWVGPAALLSFLSECLAPKKRDLVESYRKVTAPSRDSEVFYRLHRLSIEAFRQQNATPSGEGMHAQAA